MDDNPYAAPIAHVDDTVATAADAHAERRAHLRRETGLRAVGLLCLLFGAYFVLMGGVMGWVGLQDPEVAGGTLGVGLSTAFVAAGLLALATAWGYLWLRPWVRLPAALLALVTLFVSLFLTAPLVGYAAWLTFTARGLRVLSWDYAAIRAATPRLQAWRWPGEALVLLGMLGLYFVAIAVIVAGMPRG